MSEKDPSQPLISESNLIGEIQSKNNFNKEQAQKNTSMSNELSTYINELETYFSENKENILSHTLTLNKVKENIHQELEYISKTFKGFLISIDQWEKQLSCTLEMIDQSVEALKQFKIDQQIVPLDFQSNKLLKYDLDNNDLIENIISELPGEEDEYYNKFQIYEIQNISLDFALEIGLFNKIIEQFKSERKDLQTSNKINYQEIGSYLIPQNQKCNVITFNNESTLMIVGCWQTIQIYSFNDGELNLIQSLSDHTDNIMSLYFMKKKNNCFISGGKDNTIRIWIYDQEWKCNQVINVGTQKYNFFSLIMNKYEDLIISTTGDRYIQFLIQDQQQQWSCQQKIPFFEWNFNNLCLNNEENLLALTADDKIYILQKDEQNNWLGKQIFKFYAPSLLFLNDDTFIIQRFNTIDILKQGDNGEFETIKSIPIKVGKSCWNKAMAMQYNENMSIILVKGQEYLNIIKIKENDDFITESYFLESENFIGSMTNDGAFLVICDNSTQTFKVKKTDNGIMQKFNQLQMSI